MDKKRVLTLIAISIAVVVLSGCSFVRILNVAAGSVTVSVNVPDSGSSYTRAISSGGIVDVFSGNGGRYSVSIIPSERYKEILTNLQQQITRKLFEERQSLTAGDVAELVERLNHVDQMIEELSDPMPSCSGHLPDFETVVVTVSYDDFSSDYAISCGSGSGE